MTDSLTFPNYTPIPLPSCIYAPIPTAFIAETEELDIQTTVKHAKRIAKAGIGLVTCGSTGEAIQLSSKERAKVIYSIRKEFEKEKELQKIPIIAGTGGGSLKETVELSKDAKEAGADAVIVISPGYFGSNLSQDRKALLDFFTQVADQSPLPVMIYNFPAVTGGIDMDSELLEEIVKHPNICGAKLTCAGVGKLGRLANSKFVQNRKTPFHIAPGFGDIIFPCMMIGSTAAIVGTANIIPRFCFEHFSDIQNFLKNPSNQLLSKIQKDQDIISRFDRATSKTGIVGTKWMLEKFYYHQGPPRKPLRPLELDFSSMKEAVMPALQREKELEKSSGIQEDLQKDV